MKFIKTYKLFESNSDLVFKLKKLGITNYSISDDCVVDVNGNVNSNGESNIKYGKVTGYFIYISNHLKYLTGSPREVGDEFNCADYALVSLKGAPLKVGGNFNCSYNQLESLEHCSLEIGKNFQCSNNKLTSLKGCPSEIGGYFDCSNNQLQSLEHCPLEIGGSFYCYNNKLTMLDCSSYVKGDIICEGMFDEEPEFFGDCEGKIIWKY